MAYESGCRTVCINPKNTCSTNKNVWNNVVKNADDLRDILPCILNNKSKESPVQE